MNVREIAVRLLIEYEETGKYVNLSLFSHLTDALTKEERAFLTALLYTAVERKITYDYYIGALSGRGENDITPRVRAILRLGICQIVDMEKIPDFAAVNESVKLAKNRGERAFINGVLRAVCRCKENLPMPNKEKNISRFFSVKYSFPQRTVKHFISLYGRDMAERLLARFNETPPTDLTVNILKISRDDFLKRLLKDGYCAAASEYSHITVRVYGSLDPRSIYGYEEGLFFVQDTASAVCSLALGACEGEHIIDVCSAPGGKSFAAAILMKDVGRVTSFDLHESKLSLIESGKARLGLTSVTVGSCDGKAGREELISTLDRVICDVPCSGLGVLGKKPDLRYKPFEKLSELPKLQYEILCTSSKYLKVGGYIMYSTCTLNKSENEDVVLRFLDENPEFSAVDFEVGTLKSVSGMLTLIPKIHNTDGFFMAKLRKNS